METENVEELQGRRMSVMMMMMMVMIMKLLVATALD